MCGDGDDGEGAICVRGEEAQKRLNLLLGMFRNETCVDIRLLVGFVDVI